MDFHLLAFYEENDNFKEFVDKYSTKHKITIEEALTHVIVKETAKMYNGGNK